MRTKIANYFHFRKKQAINAYAKQLALQDFYDTYKSLFTFSLIISIFCQIASLASGFSYFQTVLEANIKNYYLLIVSTLLVGVVVELAKHFVVSSFCKQLFRIRKPSLNVVLLVLCLAISSISIYASVIGGGLLGVDNQKVVNTETKHDKEIALLRGEIDAIQKRNTWKGNTYIAGKDKELLLSKENELSRAKQLKESELQAVQAENVKKETVYRYAFACFELVFLACVGFIYYFKKRAVVENKINNSVYLFSSSPKLGFAISERSNENRNNENRNENRNNENRICKHCNKPYVHKHHKQVYCSESCRIEAWELRKGRSLKRKGGVNE